MGQNNKLQSLWPLLFFCDEEERKKLQSAPLNNNKQHDEMNPKQM